MAGNYDTQTVLGMLFDINTDDGINNDRIRGDSNRDSSIHHYERQPLDVIIQETRLSV